MGYPIFTQVRYKIGDKNTLPTNKSPSSRPVIGIFEFFVNNKENMTRSIDILIEVKDDIDEATLILELWIYDVDKNEWVYTGIWNHLHVKVVRAPIL